MSSLSACRLCAAPLPPVTLGRVRVALECLTAALDPRSPDYPGDDRVRDFARGYAQGVLAWMDRRCTACRERT